MARIRQGFTDGELEYPISAEDKLLVSAGIKNLKTIEPIGHTMALILDPHGPNKEIVHIVDHVIGQNTAKVERGAEGTTAHEFDKGTYWKHGPTTVDFLADSQGDITYYMRNDLVLHARSPAYRPAAPRDLVSVWVYLATAGSTETRINVFKASAPGATPVTDEKIGSVVLTEGENVAEEFISVFVDAGEKLYVKMGQVGDGAQDLSIQLRF